MYQMELDAALEAARAAGVFLAGAYERFQAVPDAPASITTAADLQVQEIILQHLHGRFPGDALCAEEATPTLKQAAGTGDRLWIVDPIDGTRGFARKNGEFSIMIAFVDTGVIAAGVVLQPAARRLTYAAKGQGCWRLDGDAATAQRCRVSDISTLAEATLTRSRARDPSRRPAYLEALAPKRIVESYSAGIKLALVARGEADIYLNTYDAFHDWDICAGHILVAEAGGTVTASAGETLRYGLAGAWQRAGLLATNSKIHAEAVRRMSARDRPG